MIGESRCGQERHDRVVRLSTSTAECAGAGRNGAHRSARTGTAAGSTTAHDACARVGETLPGGLGHTEESVRHQQLWQNHYAGYTHCYSFLSHLLSFEYIIL